MTILMVTWLLHLHVLLLLGRVLALIVLLHPRGVRLFMMHRLTRWHALPDIVLTLNLSVPLGDRNLIILRLWRRNTWVLVMHSHLLPVRPLLLRVPRATRVLWTLPLLRLLVRRVLLEPLTRGHLLMLLGTCLRLLSVLAEGVIGVEGMGAALRLLRWRCSEWNLLDGTRPPLALRLLAILGRRRGTMFSRFGDALKGPEKLISGGWLVSLLRLVLRLLATL